MADKNGWQLTAESTSYAGSLYLSFSAVSLCCNAAVVVVFIDGNAVVAVVEIAFYVVVDNSQIFSINITTDDMLECCYCCFVLNACFTSDHQTFEVSIRSDMSWVHCSWHPANIRKKVFDTYGNRAWALSVICVIEKCKIVKPFIEHFTAML